MNDINKFLDDAMTHLLTKYIDEPKTEELADKVMSDLLQSFGSNTDAKVVVDTDTDDIEVTMRDLLSNIKTYSMNKLLGIGDHDAAV